MVLAVAVVAWSVAAVAIRIAYRGEPLPGTTIAGIDVGGADEEALRVRLEPLALPHTVVLRAGEERVVATSGDVGERLAREDTFRVAVDAGRAGLLDLLATPARTLGAGSDVRPVVRFDDAAVGRTVARLAAAVDEPASRGALTSSLEAVAPRPGLRLRRRATAAALTEAFERRDVVAQAVVETVPAPPLEAVERVAQEARDYVARGPLRLIGAGRTIELGGSRLARILAVERARARDVRLGAASDALSAVVARIAKARHRPPRDARVIAPAAPVLVDGMADVAWRPQRGEVSVTPGRPGRAVDPVAATKAIGSAIKAGEHVVELPVSTPAPRLAGSAAREIRHVIGTFTTRFECCQPRARNIRLIAEAVDGTVVLPGEQFSLNGTAGPRTRDRGFVPAPFIADGKIVPSVGGGVSQFSTTLYNAAYFAGLQLDAHQPHSFYIDRYPAGREATLDYDSIDLLWTNDTQAPVLVRATSAATSVNVTLYGDNGGRRVRARAGARRPVADGDFQITVTRSVRYPDGRVATQPYTTTYDKPPED